MTATIEQARAAIARLTSGTVVGHANPELADWVGTVKPNRRGRLVDLGRYVRVLWTAGTGGDGQSLAPDACWVDATALAIAGTCPGCERAAHFVFAGNDWDRPEGWYHDDAPDRSACRAGNAVSAGCLKITLSMPRTSPGEAQIRAKGTNLDAIVGDCVRSGRKWRATLWSRAGQRTPGDPFIFGASLREIRDEQLQPQIDRDGPWWQ